MQTAEPGNTVKVHYTGKRQDGSVFDSSAGRDPLEFKIGDGKVMPSFESNVVGMKVGETKTAHIAAQDGFGTRQEEKVIVVERKSFPADIEPRVGRRLQMVSEDGDAVAITVTEVTEKEVTVDANHPLAGEDLTFDIELVEIV